MEIKTKFKIGSLVKVKYDRWHNGDRIDLFEVLEIMTQTCYKDSQIFYIMRQIVCEKKYEKEFTKTGDYEWFVFHGTGASDHSSGWKKYREDELEFVSDETRAIVLGDAIKKEVKRKLEE